MPGAGSARRKTRAFGGSGRAQELGNLRANPGIIPVIAPLEFLFLRLRLARFVLVRHCKTFAALKGSRSSRRVQAKAPLLPPWTVSFVCSGRLSAALLCEVKARTDSEIYSPRVHGPDTRGRPKKAGRVVQEALERRQSTELSYARWLLCTRIRPGTSRPVMSEGGALKCALAQLRSLLKDKKKMAGKSKESGLRSFYQ